VSEHEELNPDDPLPKLIADIDQMIATAPRLGQAAWGFYEGFRAAGFTDNQSLFLVAVQLKDPPFRGPE
jgi:hypothetical protein